MLDRLSDETINKEYVLCKIVRYNNRPKMQKESVAEHTCFVSVFCLKILQQLKLDKETERQVLVLAALHDLAETRTSDIPHDVKANYPEMRSILDRIEDDYYREEWPEYYNEVQKASPLVHAIVKMADTYSVIQYCYNERRLGNMSDVMEEILMEANDRLDFYMSEVNKELAKES